MRPFCHVTAVEIWENHLTSDEPPLSLRVPWDLTSLASQTPVRSLSVSHTIWWCSVGFRVHMEYTKHRKSRAKYSQPIRLFTWQSWHSTWKRTKSHQTLPSPFVILEAICAGVGWVWLARLETLQWLHNQLINQSINQSLLSPAGMQPAHEGLMRHCSYWVSIHNNIQKWQRGVH